MAFGIECPDGWYSLLYAMCQRLERIQDEYGITVVADQVKEKYGSLRFYNHIEFGERWKREENGGEDLPYKEKYKHLLDGQEFTNTTFRHGWEGHSDTPIKIVDSVEQRVDYIINKFTGVSYLVCGKCGTTGNFENPMGGTNGWISYVCKNCNGDNKNWYPSYGPKKVEGGE